MSEQGRADEARWAEYARVPQDPKYPTGYRYHIERILTHYLVIDNDAPGWVPYVYASEDYDDCEAACRSLNERHIFS